MNTNVKKIYVRKMKMIAIMLLSVFTCQLLYPNITMALTTGPSQPEVQAFEPVGTTDMVDMFSGDFVYNIPLLDVEGYPVNISYHAGVTMEQEASWVGLGWNINPGTINRTVRGVPDDFNGDSLFKDINIKPEKTLRVGVGGGVELAGDGDPSTLGLDLSLGAAVNFSNYRGVSADIDLGCGINAMGCVSAGVNIGVGSQTGRSIDYNASLSFSKASSQEIGKDASGGGGINVGVGGGYSTRSGVKDINLTFSVKPPNGKLNFNSTYNIPIGVKNIVPVITNSSTMHSIYGRIKLGGEFFSAYTYGDVSAMYSRLTYNNDASRSSYGYLYLQNANVDNSSILDFTRDKDGMFNKSMQYLPVPHMTYDIYSVSGQGTGGVFRPFRNDFGNVYDPFTASTSSSEKGEAEGGIGNAFEIGLDYTHTNTEITSGPWMDYQRSGTLSKGFTSDKNGSIYEHAYFKMGGELTSVDSDYFNILGKTAPVSPDAVMSLPQTKPSSSTLRDPRANLIYYRTAKEESVRGAGTDILSNQDPNFTGYGSPESRVINRIGSGNFQRKKDQISKIIQVQKDGKKYVYGIPAMNNVQREVTFSVDTTTGTNPVNLGDGLVSFSGSDATSSNSKGRDNYYNSTVTPSYAHSYLLTSVFSADYVDVTGNGPTDDDLGSFTKFNYTRSDSDFRWVAPYSSGVNVAQYNPGFWSDRLDDKGSFVCGSREQWYLHSIETKNFIAEFYTSPRHDAQGIVGQILNLTGGGTFNSAKSSPSLSYKLDSIKLYNKHDRFINTVNAIPIKTIFFAYNYSLCSGTLNSDPGYGKLTLSKIYFRYGNSQKSMISPYQFEYNYNPDYDQASKDRWGCYKPNNKSFTNYEFPYVDQNDALNDEYASSWLLSTVVLPSGGLIRVQYESKDYAYVQDKPANEMFIVQGLGNSNDFVNGSQLYRDNNNPFLYAYFLRRSASELASLSFAQNYMGRNFQPNTENCVYFNFNVRLTGNNKTFEQIKGYANVTDVGICGNDSRYGYVKFKSQNPTGGGATLNPITYTALNVGRFNLSQVVFPGSNPDESSLRNILSGLKGAFNELINIGKSPIVNLVKKNGGQVVKLDKSYIRLQSPGLCKKGGGQRVKALTFGDQWTKLAGGNEQVAYYGKQYDYTINDPEYGKISSGVASYEPLIGGDENPLRQPVPYIGQSGSSFPPNDPVDLYQETPIGESLFPSAQIGYRQVTVTSLHANAGRSSQGIDKYEFYTAKDFPAQVIATGINKNESTHYDFFSQSNTMTATQGYTLIFNDMHGKPKRVEHDVYNPTSQTLQPISRQVFNYRQNISGRLNNNVPCMIFNGTNMVVQNRQLGIEEDVTLDSRRKNEVTHTSTLNGNLNLFIFPFIIPIPVPIPLKYTWSSEGQNEFRSAAVTKVIQQYGILDNVVTLSDNALTTVKNEIYDPNTGQAVVTSVNNEFQDKEYTTNIPASWVYKGMGPTSNNIAYKDTGTIWVGLNHIGTLNLLNTAPLVAGDELAISYTDASNYQHNTIASVLGPVPVNVTDTVKSLSPHYHYHYDTTYTVSPAYKACYHENSHFDNIGVCEFASNNWWDAVIASTSGRSLGYGIDTIWNYREYALNVHGHVIDTCVRHWHPESATRVQFYIDTAHFQMWETYPGGVVPPAVPGDSGSNFTLTFDTTITNFDSLTYATNYYLIGRDPRWFDIGYGLRFGYYDIDSVALPKFGHTWLACQIFVTPTVTPDTGYYDTTYHYSTWTSVTYDTLSTVLLPGSCSGINVLPRFPLNTPGWDVHTMLSNVSIKVINSGQTNRLNENVESYTSMDYPVNTGTGVLNTALTHLINLQARTYADSNTMILHKYIANADTVNPFTIGERGVWRLFTEYKYKTGRNYTGVTARNSGLFIATSLFAPPSGLPTTCFLTPYTYLAPTYADNHWRKERTITKYSPNGKEIENVDALGNYSTAVFGYNEELPVAVASNAWQGEVFTDGFEDYNLLQCSANIMNYKYSPFNNYSSTSLGYSAPMYYLLNTNPSGPLTIAHGVSHTGMNSLNVASGGSTFTMHIPVNRNSYSGMLNHYNVYYPHTLSSPYRFSYSNEYLPFELNQGKSYILSYWIKASTLVLNPTDYSIASTCGVTVNTSFNALVKKTNIIDGWQQVETKFSVDSADTSASFALPRGYYIDDIRVFPANSNMKSFVYHPVNEKLMATLDENNFATMYEYDQEGNLIRVKKETSKGILTTSENRSSNPKTVYP